MTRLLAVRDIRREIRCCMCDPDGFLIEVGHATGLVDGRLAEQARAGGEAGGSDGR
jgi:hypothetical protein